MRFYGTNEVKGKGNPGFPKSTTRTTMFIKFWPNKKRFNCCSSNVIPHNVNVVWRVRYERKKNHFDLFPDIFIFWIFPAKPRKRKVWNFLILIFVLYFHFRPFRWDWYTGTIITAPLYASCPFAPWLISCRTRLNSRRCSFSWLRGRSSLSFTFSSGSSCTNLSATRPGPRARPTAGTQRAWAPPTPEPPGALWKC